MKKTIFDGFCGLYKQSKTLRFELRPVGKTLENMRDCGVLDRDLARCAQYRHVKDLLDAQHKALLERSLSSADAIVSDFDSDLCKKFAMAIGRNRDIDWKPLAEAYVTFRKSNKDRDARQLVESANASYRMMVTAVLESDGMFASLCDSTPSKFFKQLLKKSEEEGVSPDVAIMAFSSFACYFKGYQENRKNIYSSEKQATSAANRAIDENFPRFMNCCSIFAHLAELYPGTVSQAEKELSSLLNGKSLGDVFSIDNYSWWLSQSGIECFNAVVGGVVTGTGSKIRGINEFVNLLRQQEESAHNDRKLALMPKLFKQILSDREGLSFAAEPFETDRDVLRAIGEFAEGIEKSKCLIRLRRLLNGITPRSGLYVDANKLSDVSIRLCGNWSALGDAFRRKCEASVSCIAAKGKREKALKSLLGRDEYPIVELNDLAIPDDSVDGYRVVSVADCWRCEGVTGALDAVGSALENARSAIGRDDENGLREREGDVAAIKAYLDAVQDVLHAVRPLRVSAELERDMEFYGDFDALYDELDQIALLYNRVRNYIVRKPSETQKMKLMFDCPTLADGWDLNKEPQNKAVLLERNGQYYLGVANVSSSARAQFSPAEPTSGPVYRKMVYKLLPGPNKMLPKVFFSAKGAELYGPSRDLLESYRAGEYKKGPSFDLVFCHRLIDYFKKSIQKNPDWKVFDFKFSPTSSYAGIDEFYREVSEQGYKLSFMNVSAADVDGMVDRGELFLFKLHTKDFAKGSTGRKNLHTLYWEMLFDSRNLLRPVYKLNGEAELFYRPMSITHPYAHEKGEKLVNRLDKLGNPIPELAFGELFAYANGHKPVSELGSEARALLDSGLVIIKDVNHRIVKDARYAQEKFFFHVPITLNANAPDKLPKFNEYVNNAVRETDDVNVIGIDRGERNLLYVCVINRRGEILEQRSFNTIGCERFDGQVANIDYHAKLEDREHARDAARKSWSTIGKIKDLKAGYLSVVVHEIARMMVRYNAVITLEDLNFGFKRGRFAIERQVYQKFEKALIDKLNFLVFKDGEVENPGGLLRGYQLTDKFDSFDRLGRQSGFLYYVPAAYTSKIDPTTGFTNLFDFKKCTGAESIREFFQCFKSIVYSASEGAFAFAFDYNDFTTRLKGGQTCWTVYSASRRLTYRKDGKTGRGCEIEIHPTDIIRDAVETIGDHVVDGYNLLSLISSKEPTRDNAKFFKDVFYAFERTLQMRNSSSLTGEDYIASPVKNGDGRFFDSREADTTLPKDADANGAYHIALKGLWMITDGLRRQDLHLDNETWFKYRQQGS